MFYYFDIDDTSTWIRANAGKTVGRRDRHGWRKVEQRRSSCRDAADEPTWMYSRRVLTVFVRIQVPESGTGRSKAPELFVGSQKGKR